MATTTRRRPATDFDIHQDGPATEDTEMNLTDAGADEDHEEEDEHEEEEDADDQGHVDDDDDDEARFQDEEPEQQPHAEPEPQSEQSEQEGDNLVFSEDEDMDEDMRKLQDAFPGFKHKYRLIKRIGEGMSCRAPCLMPPFSLGSVQSACLL